MKQTFVHITGCFCQTFDNMQRFNRVRCLTTFLPHKHTASVTFFYLLTASSVSCFPSRSTSLSSHWTNVCRPWLTTSSSLMHSERPPYLQRPSPTLIKPRSCKLHAHNASEPSLFSLTLITDTHNETQRWRIGFMCRHKHVNVCTSEIKSNRNATNKTPEAESESVKNI